MEQAVYDDVEIWLPCPFPGPPHRHLGMVWVIRSGLREPLIESAVRDWITRRLKDEEEPWQSDS